MYAEGMFSIFVALFQRDTIVLNYSLQESDQLHDFSQKTTFRPFYRTIRCTPVAVSMDFAEFLDMPPFFYNEVLKEVCHKCLGTGMVREKTVRTAILPRLQALRNMKVLEDGKAEASTDEPSSSSGLAPNSGVILDKSAQYGKKAQARYLRRKTEGMRKDCFITLRKESLSFFTEARLIIFRDGFKVGKKCDNSKSQEVCSSINSKLRNFHSIQPLLIRVYPGCLPSH